MIRVQHKKDIQLPVVNAGAKRIRPSRMSKWRAMSLVAVHLLILGHVIHWWYTGRTISPVEPSESMESLETGRINAGIVFFAVSIAATLVFGRFFCGWGCHLIAYQDLCTWLLKKVGIRPKPLRARVLIFAPLGLAFYMFVWPTLERWLEGRTLSPLSNSLMTTQFWKTFPGPAVAILTVLVAGFCIVYFLGNKGFCTYGCPYGAFYGTADKAAPMRVRVTEACDGSSHCTAVCSSNVDVAKEVRLHGMVINPGCMKCGDCISVCPNDALYFGFGAPPIVDRVRRKGWRGLLPARKTGPPKPATHLVSGNLNWGEEFFVAGVFLSALLSWRGLYGTFPLLLSMAIAAIIACAALLAARLFYRGQVTLQNRVLKSSGRIRLDGWIGLGLTGIVLLFTAHAGMVQYHDWVATKYFDRTDEGLLFTVSGDDAGDLDKGIVPQALRAAFFKHGVTLPETPVVSAGAPARHGLVGRWFDSPYPEPDPSTQEPVRQWTLLAGGAGYVIERHAGELWIFGPGEHVWRSGFDPEIHLPARVRRARDAALRHLTWCSKWGLADWVDLNRKLAWLELLDGDPASAERHLRRALTLEPELPNLHYYLGKVLVLRGQDEAALREYQRALEIKADYREASMESIQTLIRMGRLDEAETAAQDAVRRSSGSAASHFDLAQIYKLQNKTDLALQELREAVRVNPDSHEARSAIGLALMAAGKFDEALEHYRAELKHNEANGLAHYNLAGLLLNRGEIEGGVQHLRRAVALEPELADAHEMLGRTMVGMNRLDEAAACFREALRLDPNLVQAYYNLGVAQAMQQQYEQARASLEAALRLTPNDAQTHALMSQVLVQLNRPDEAREHYLRAVELEKR